MTPLPLNVTYYGSEQPLPDRRPLRAGPLTAVFEAGDLRYIKLGEREVLRRVYVAVRDRHWGTIPLRMAALRVEEGADWFRIGYEAEHQRGDIDFVWRGAITGGSDGTIRFTMDGEARSTFLRNRIGFCVLHPIRECAGQRCVVETADGPRLDGRFPTLIAPHQPFREMRAIAHEVAPGLRAEVRFSGDIFEMEDQRNWSDASYKTYCTPLRLAYPVEITRGTKVLQSVTVTLIGTAGSIGAAREAAPRMITLGEASGTRLPRIGLGMASHEQSLSEAEVARLRGLNLDHLRVDLHLAQEYQATLRRAAMDAGRLHVPLEVALFLSDEAESQLSQLRAACESLAVNVCAWLVFHQQEPTTGERWVRLARHYLGDYAAAAIFAGGTNLHFIEFGGARLPLSLMDAACYSITPQAHAFDNASVIENAEAIASTIESARAACEGLPIIISPVTLRPRFNPDATADEPAPAPGELPSQVDPRQMSLFGAGWTLASLKYIAEAGGVESVTYYETTGWRGVMETAGGSPAPETFQSRPGAVFPMYHVLADVGELAEDAVVVPATSNDTLQVDALAIRRQGGTRVLVANLTDAAQTVAIRGLKHTLATIRPLDETCTEQATLEPGAFRGVSGASHRVVNGELTVHLLPYAIARIDAMDVRGLCPYVSPCNHTFPYWFCDNFRKSNDNEAALPVDQHQVLALIAPRPLYVASAQEDLLADPRGEFLGAVHASGVWELLRRDGLPAHEMPPVHQPSVGTLAYHIRAGRHDITGYDWEQYLAFADKRLPRALAPKS